MSSNNQDKPHHYHHNRRHHHHDYVFPSNKAQHVIETETTDLQTATELECAPFFVNLTTLSESQLGHLREVGLLPPLRFGLDGEEGGGGGVGQEVEEGESVSVKASLAAASSVGHGADRNTKMSDKAAKILGVQHPPENRANLFVEDDEGDISERIVILEEIRDDQKQHAASISGEAHDVHQNQNQLPNSIINNKTNTNSNPYKNAYDPYAIRLLRKQHTNYLTNALSLPLSRGFVSLDASHPWMIYWILHSLDLLGYFDDDVVRGDGDDDDDDYDDDDDDIIMKEVETIQKAELLKRVVSTLSHCWTDVPLEFDGREVQNDAFLQQLHKTANESESESESEQVTITGGGFAGGPSQMPHCAPTYAAVLALSIVAGIGLLGNATASPTTSATTTTTTSSAKSPTTSNTKKNPYQEAGEMAMELLTQKRLKLYAFFLSLREWEGGSNTNSSTSTDKNTGEKNCINDEDYERIAFRMQHDGEIDVRASYCLLAPAKLLGLLQPTTTSVTTKTINTTTAADTTITNNPLLSPSISRHISTCQTYEGGFGAEPYNEAHGGYTFCALAALRILDNDSSSSNMIDVPALRSWLARRQMGYEGGFCGRTNKLVDGCYSFWQGGAVAVLDEWFYDHDSEENNGDVDVDGKGNNVDDGYEGEQAKNELTFDEVMLQRYILLCAQDVNGGLRDKPSKPRDFYHSCYNLSGLSVAQHALQSWPDGSLNIQGIEGGDNGVAPGLNRIFGDVGVNIVGRTDPVLNIRVERVKFMLSQKF